MEREAVLRLMDQRFGRSVLRAVARGYKVRAKLHRPGIGDNATTFGMNVRFSTEKYLEEELGTMPGVFVARPMGAFQITFREHIFHFYKFGTNDGDSIDELNFEDSLTKINIVMDNQMSLPGIPVFRHWVIAHSGNPNEGLREVYIGAPHRYGSTGSPWAWRHQVFHARNLDLRQEHADTDFADPAFDLAA